MSYVAVVAFNRDGSSSVHVDSSKDESMISMEALSTNPNVVSAYRKVVDKNLFIAYSNGSELVAERSFNHFGEPRVRVRTPYNKPSA